MCITGINAGGHALLKCAREDGILLAEERVGGPVSEDLSGSMGEAWLRAHGELAYWLCDLVHVS